MEKGFKTAPWVDTHLRDRNREEWIDIVDYDGHYQISDHGRVKSLCRHDRLGRLIKEKIMKQLIDNHCQASVVLSVDGNAVRKNIIGLVGFHFLGNKKDGNIFYHKNKITFDNRSCNICIGTHSESMNVNYAIGGHSVYWKRLTARKEELSQKGLRRCTNCKEIKETISDFHNNKNDPEGKSLTCKECICKSNKEYYKKRIEIDMKIDIMSM